MNSFIVLLLDVLNCTVPTEVCRTNIKQFTILYQGQKLWNSLPHSIIESNNIRSFKCLHKSYLVNLEITQLILQQGYKY